MLVESMLRRFCWLAFSVVTTGCLEFDPQITIADSGSSRITFPDFDLDGGIPGDAAAIEAFLIANGVDPGLAEQALESRRLGEACDNKTNRCRDGLNCEDGLCAGAAETEVGEGCFISAECDDGQCLDNECVPAGDGVDGVGCTSNRDCRAGLRCGIVGIAAQCVSEGQSDLGGNCETSNDCASGLACYQAHCVSVPGAPPAIPSSKWQGVECEEPSEDGVRAYFEVPGAEGAREGDFFRLPFPSDVRLTNEGRVDLKGFPTPGLNPLTGTDPLAPYVDVVNGSEGWGTNPTVTFRFSAEVDFSTLDVAGGVNWVDITDPSAGRAGVSYRTFTGNTNYACHNAFTVRREDGAPLEPGHTYAVWLTADATDPSGVPVKRSENFRALMRDQSPTDGPLARAHARFAAFREYLEAQEIDRESVLVATVFSVGPVRDPMTRLAKTVLELPMPSTSGWTLCTKDGKSPCPDAEEGRACATSSSYEEYHALVELPIFQKGEPPYEATGGGIVTSEPVRKEQVCMSLTLPKTDMPSDGWPLVVFGHGTGGSFRSHVRAEIAGELAAAGFDGALVPMAVLGVDAVQHGPRRGESDKSPNDLFFNFANPEAAKGNPIQGAADVLSVGRVAANLNLTAKQSGGRALRVNPDAVVYFGHSQGAMHGSLGVPYSPHYRGAVLSGNGASLMHAMLTKTNPTNIAALIPFIVDDADGDGKLMGGIHHPALSLIQQYIDPADPLNFAQQIARSPLGDSSSKHVFQVYGQRDTYSPGPTMRMYAKAGRLAVVQAHSSADSPDDLGSESPNYPFSASFGVDGVEYTAAVRQYAPPKGVDGHFVSFDVPDARGDIARFLAAAATGAVPVIGD